MVAYVVTERNCSRRGRLPAHFLRGEPGVEDRGRVVPGVLHRAQEETGRLGTAGVPFYVFDSRYALSGAQPAEVFGRAFDAVCAGKAT